MTGDTDLYPSGELDLAQRRGRLLVPALLATCLSLPLLALSALLWLVAEVVLAHSGLPEGLTYLPPSASERAGTIAQHIAPIVLGGALLFLTWRYRHRGRSRTTWLCGTAAVLVGIAALWW